jgi:glutamine phosphoribosylpyrophosphate amidotransferase
VEEIRSFLGADSLGYLTLENLRAAVEDTAGRFCTSCFTGNYPTEFVQLEVNSRDNSSDRTDSAPVTVAREH